VLYRFTGALYYRLLPWWRTAAVRAATESVPLVRPLWFDYPDDPALRGIEDEMLVGDGLLAAPVVRDAAWDRRVYLPAGRWYHYWSGTPFEGGREYIVDAHVDAVDGLPLFVRGGSVLVYGPPCDRCPTEAPDELWIDAYPGGSSEGAIRWDADTPPLLGWQFNGSTLRLTAGPRTLRLHVANGGSSQTLVLAPDARASVTMEPVNGPRIPTPLGDMRE
jgi:alpha-glucosidase (family GH31 glycosyl hydrolase)